MAHFQNFGDKKTLVSRVSKMGRIAVRKLLLFCQKVTKMGSTIGPRIDYNGLGVQRVQRLPNVIQVHLLPHPPSVPLLMSNDLPPVI